MDLWNHQVMAREPVEKDRKGHIEIERTRFYIIVRARSRYYCRSPTQDGDTGRATSQSDATNDRASATERKHGGHAGGNNMAKQSKRWYKSEVS